MYNVQLYIYIVLYYVICIQLILVGPLSRPTSDLEDLEGERGGEGGFTWMNFKQSWNDLTKKILQITMFCNYNEQKQSKKRTVHKC